MYLRDIAIYADEQIAEGLPSGFVGWFHRESCCITELYCSLLSRKLVTSDTAKVNLVFVDQAVSAPTVRQLLAVADARWPFDFPSYAERDELGKKRMMLDSLHAALLWIAKVRGWGTKAFNDAYSQALNRNLTFEGLSKKSWHSPNRRHKARIGSSYGLRNIHLVLLVYDSKGNELGRKPLGEVVPEMGVVHWILRQKAAWNSRNVFRIQIGGYCFHVPKKLQVNLSDLLTTN
jgi:hypothetical protein